MREQLFILWLVLSIQSAISAPFQNLGFDAATTSTSTIGYNPDLGLISGFGPAGDLLPAWQLFQGTTQRTLIGYNGFPLDGPNATLISQDASAFYQFPVEGSYAMLLDGGSPLITSFSLHQQGDIPAGVKYLTIREVGGIFVAVNNILIPPFFGNPGDSTEVFYDISPFAGQNVDLGLSTTYSKFDSLAFVVPEPSTWVLFGLGGLGLLIKGLRWRL